MSDAEKIRRLKAYRDAVAQLSVGGNRFLQERYELLTQQVLTALLAREPSEQDLEELL